jgi:hypothetical protein
VVLSNADADLVVAVSRVDGGGGVFPLVLSDGMGWSCASVVCCSGDCCDCVICCCCQEFSLD